MKILHLLKSPSDGIQETLLKPWLESGNENTVQILDEIAPDYDRLLDLIFTHDRVISWPER